MPMVHGIANLELGARGRILGWPLSMWLIVITANQACILSSSLNPAGIGAGNGLQTRFEASPRVKPPESLFAMSYCPSGHPEVRIRAIDMYWDFLQSGPLRIENELYRYSRKVYGEKTFAGIHSTIHNHLNNDEPWASGLDWWTEPRQYGMSDEDLSLPLRMGLLVSHPGNIMYDQFYRWKTQRFAIKALNDARIHYQGYNDTGAWGVDLSSTAFLNAINPVEQKIRLLNRSMFLD